MDDWCPVTGIAVKYGFSTVMDIRWVDATICQTGCLDLIGISKGGSMVRFNDSAHESFLLPFLCIRTIQERNTKNHEEEIYSAGGYLI